MSRTTSVLGRAIAALALTVALAVGSALTALPAAHAQSDAAGDARFALGIGANQGGQGDVELLYAEQDASRVGEALTALADGLAIIPEGIEEAPAGSESSQPVSPNRSNAPRTSSMVAPSRP